jgi:hypothetical protein
MTADKAARTRVRDAIRKRPDTAAGIAQRLLMREASVTKHLRILQSEGRACVACTDADGCYTWAYGASRAPAHPHSSIWALAAQQQREGA